MRREMGVIDKHRHRQSEREGGKYTEAEREKER